MSINKIWLSDQQFARSMRRQIDRETLIDLLGIIIYEADRSSKLEEAGFADQASSVDCLFDYVLDALAIPPETETFSREPFEELLYNDFWLGNQIESLDQVVTALEELRDAQISRLGEADVRRANIRVVDTDND